MSFVAALVFLCGNAFFVAAQFSLITARRDQIEPLAAQGNRAAKAARRQVQSLPNMLAGSQLGIAACSLGLGAVAEPAIVDALRSALLESHLPAALLHAVAFVIALALVSYVHMVLGEMVPKNLALAGPVRAALLLGRPMGVWVRLTRPILVVVNGAANLLLHLVHVTAREELGGTYTADELGDLFAESAAVGLLDREEQARLRAVLAVESITAADLMIGTAELVTVREPVTPSEVEELVARSGFSRFPVLSGSEMVGYLHAKDLLELDESAFNEPIPASRYRALVSVSLTDSVDEVVRALRGTRTHLCQVVDGGVTVGVITLEDVLRAVVGSGRR